MGQQHGFGRGLGRQMAHQRVEVLVFEDGLECFHPVRPLGVAGGNQVFKADRIGIVKSGHTVF